MGVVQTRPMSLARANRVYNAARLFNRAERVHAQRISEVREGEEKYGRKRFIISYTFSESGSCLKIQGENTPQWGPALKGAIYWLLRRPGRQATYSGGKFYFEEAQDV